MKRGAKAHNPLGHLSATQLPPIPAAPPPAYPSRGSWASHHCPTSLGIPLANIALFLSLRMFSFSVENAKYLERVGEVNE